jgi:hypothetical protein
MRSLPGHIRYVPTIPLVPARLTVSRQLVLCLCALAHCLFALFLLLKHFLVAPFPAPLCVFERPFEILGMPGDALALLLLSGVGCRYFDGAHMRSAASRP